MKHHIIKFLAVLALGAMLLMAFRPMPKIEHELVGSWQYVKFNQNHNFYAMMQ